MKIENTELDGVKCLTPRLYEDNRGRLIRTYDENVFANHGLSELWLQENISFTKHKNTIRGIHVSLPPSLEGKLITPISGIMQWVVVDLRKGSKTFGEHLCFTLSDETYESIYVPRGFAHGCLSLTDHCLLAIKSNEIYSESAGTGILWNDMDLKINWTLAEGDIVISDRDSKYLPFKNFLDTYSAISV